MELSIDIIGTVLSINEANDTIFFRTEKEGSLSAYMPNANFYFAVGDTFGITGLIEEGCVINPTFVADLRF